MEDVCWGCGSPSHHRRDCDQLDVQFQKQVADYRRNTVNMDRSKLKNQIQLQRDGEKQKLKSGTLPPFVLTKTEVERLTCFLYDFERKIEAYSVKVSSADVGCITVTLELLDQLKDEFTSKLDSIRYVSAIGQGCKIQWGVDTEVQLLLDKVQDMQDAQRRLNNSLYVIQGNYRVARRFVQDFNEAIAGITTFVQNAKEVYSGRPLEIGRIRQEWKSKKETLQKCQDDARKMAYVFCDDAVGIITAQLNDVRKQWKEASALRKNDERDTPKSTCKICYEDDIQYALLCGHCYCGECLQRLNSCSFCRGSVDTFVELHL